MTTSREIHLDDEALFLALDRTDASPAANAARAHAQVCASCTARLDEMRRMADRVSADIGRIQPRSELVARVGRFSLDAPAARSPRRVWLTAAAIAALLIVPVVASGAVRSWIGGFFEALVSHETSTGAGVASPPPAEHSRTLSPSIAPTIRLEFTALGAASTLTILRWSQDRVELRAPIEPTASPPVVFEAGVRIENLAAADYRIMIPRAVERVLVTRADGSTRTLTLGADEDSLRITLSR